jgi:hypothetical protein
VRSGRPIRRGQTGRCMRHEDDGAPDTARRGGRCMRHADEWTYAAEGAQQGAYSSRGCPAERLTAAPRQRRYLPDLGGDTCLIWVAELRGSTAETVLWGEHRLVARPPQRPPGRRCDLCSQSGRAPATAPARSCDLCSQHTHVFRRALGEFGGSGRVPGRVPAPAIPGDVSSYDMAVGRGHVIIMQCFDAPASSSVACCQVGQLPTLRHDLQDLHKLCPCLSRECTVWAVDHSHASSH